MTFRVALSGLNAASTDLSVTANNIANSATSGFKSSRTEFASLFAVSSQGATSTQSGAGVRVSNISQQFSQGNIDFTDSSLDLAISGQGFFIQAEHFLSCRICLPELFIDPVRCQLHGCLFKLHLRAAEPPLLFFVEHEHSVV